MRWTPPRRPWCARVVVLVTTEQEASVSEASTIGLDIAKRVFHAHGADSSGKVVFRKRLRREQVLAFFAGQPGYLLKRPDGRPPHEVRRFYTSFSYQAQSWSKPRRVVAKVEWHFGELYPRIGFIVTNLARPAERVVGRPLSSSI